MSHEIVRHHDAEDLAVSTAARLVTTVVNLLDIHDRVSVVLTGGRIAGVVLFALADPITSGAIDWSRVDLWWGDERYLPVGDPERNDTLAETRLLSQVSIPASCIHRMAGPESSESAGAAAEAYADELAAYARSRDGRPLFDIVLLSIGPDGHVASLFPESAQLRSGELVMAVVDAPKPPPTRVSLGFTALNDCTQAWLLASGEEKAEVVDLMLTKGAGPLQIPAAGISASERTLLLIDESAASRLATDIGTR